MATERLTALIALQKRVREATGPDRELDADIAERIGGWASFPGDNWIGPHGQICVPSYTSSLDACLSLMRERLPGCMWAIGEMEEGPFCRLVYPDPQSQSRFRIGEASRVESVTLSFIDAILSAEIAKEEATEVVG